MEDKIRVVELVLSKVKEQIRAQSATDQDDANDFIDENKSANHAICSFFHNVTQLMANLLTSSGRNNKNSSHHHRFKLNYERDFNDFSDDE